MIIVGIIVTLILISLCTNALFKYKSYKKEDKTIWQDGDSVRIKGPEGESSNSDGFMTRIG